MYARLQKDRAIVLAIDDARAEVHAFGAKARAAVADRKAYAVQLVALGLAEGALLVFLAEANLVDDAVHHVLEADRVAGQLLAGHRDGILLDHVDAPHAQRVNLQLVRGDVHDLLDGEVDLRRAEAAHRAGENIVGCDAVYVGVDIVDA